jgi:hypothetical protein
MKKLVIGGIAALSAITFSSLAHADDGDQASAEQAVTAIYNQVQRGCTPGNPPNLQSISWDTFYPSSFGTGTIHDANPTLGGAFQVSYFNPQMGPAQSGAAGQAYGQWGVDLQFC